MKNLLLIVFLGIIATSHAQTKKPFIFTGNFTLNYEQKKPGATATTGNVIYAFNNFDAAIIPSFAKLMQDVVSAKLLINNNFGEMTMLTVMKSGKKNGLLTTIPKPVLVQNSKTTKAPVMTKTGLTKIIQTVTCEKIIVILSDSTKIESWVSSAIVLNVAEAIQLTNSGFRGKSPLGAVDISSLKGTPLETIITYKNGETMKLTITDIKKVKPDAAFFSSAGFTIMDARGLQMYQK